MFTDIEGSTTLATARGDEVAQNIHAIQDELVRKQLEEYGGLIDHSTGDGVLAVFRSTRRALACAVAIQRDVERHNRKQPKESFRLRIGLNSGEVIKKAGEIQGAAINAAARITDRAKGGEILVSEIVKQLVGATAEVSFTERGRLRLKGFPERWRLFEVNWPQSAVGLKLHLFGPARLEKDGETARFETKKALALLAYVALEGPQSRDHLAALFWAGYDIARARGALSRTLSAVRGASADHDLLDTDRERVAVRRERLPVDVGEFRSALDIARTAGPKEAIRALEKAVEIGRAEVLAGLTLRGAPGFEHWQYLLQEDLRRELGAGLGRLVELLHQRGGIDRALEYGRRWIELDPLHEPAHQWLMRLYAGSGDRAAAIAQYRECVRVLSEELAVSPLEETTRIYESLAVGSAVETRAAEPRSAPTIRREELPLVGRVAEEQILRRAAASEARLVVIEGEAGIGKTRLARLMSEFVVAAGRSTVEVRCHEDEASYAFGVAARLLHRALDIASVETARNIDASSAREALRLIPELAGLRDDLADPPSLDSPGAQTAFFFGVWETLTTLLGPGAAIVIDDAQWSDSGSAELLAYGIRRLERLPVIVTATWRRDEVGPDHLLRRGLADAQRAGMADVFSPRRLTVDEVALLVGATGSDTSGLAARLFEETEGVPFFVAEYLKVAVSSETEWPISTGIKELVRAQIAHLSELAAQVLTAAALLGRDLSVDLLEAVSGRSPDETADAVDELERRGLLLPSPPPGQAYHFSHEKVREIVFEDSSLARRRLLHRRAAEHLEHRGEIAAAARHARLAGRDADAARLHAAAGQRARELFANDEALAHFQSALGLGHPGKAGVHEAIGDIQTLLGRYDEALASYQSALAFADDPNTAARLEWRMGSLFLRRGEEARAESHLRRALETAGEDAERSWALAELALAVSVTGTGDPAVIGDEALRAAEVAADEAALARSQNVVGLLAVQRGDLGEARRRLQASVEVAARLPDPSAHVAALNNLALAQRDSGDQDGALELLFEAIKLCESQGDLHRAAALHNNAADILHTQGRFEESGAHSRRAAELFAQVGEDPVRQPGIWKLVSW